MGSEQPTQQQVHDERWELLRHINEITDRPMIVLSFVWLGLVILEFTIGLSGFLQVVSYIIWGLFILDFLLEITIAPKKGAYLRRSWLTALSLLLPAFRVLRIFRALRVLRLSRAARSLGLLRLLTSVNRSMRSVRDVLGRRGFGYVVILTVIITFAGAAGMAYFESASALRDAGFQDLAAQGGGLNSYGEAVWWTAMLMTTIGADYSPKTTEGRTLTFLLAVYAFAVFGYITATIASYFVGQDVRSTQAGESMRVERDDGVS